MKIQNSKYKTKRFHIVVYKSYCFLLSVVFRNFDIDLVSIHDPCTLDQLQEFLVLSARCNVSFKEQCMRSYLHSIFKETPSSGRMS